MRQIVTSNAGHGYGAALRKIAYDLKSLGCSGQRPLYEGLADLIDRAQQTNSALSEKLSEYAVTSGYGSLALFAIVEDNLNKGILAEKTEGEGPAMDGRKKRAGERASCRDKIIPAAMLLLLSLMVITNGPHILSL